MRAWSFVVHAWNEADALARLIRSSFPMAEQIAEWVVLDHRSDDHTQATLDALVPELQAHGIALKRLFEPRDLSRSLTFADIRTRTIKAASQPLVALQDADFILGPQYVHFLAHAGRQLSKGKQYFAAAFSIPVVWDKLVVEDGQVREHGRVWVHRRRARLLWRDDCAYRQVREGGRWEQLFHSRPQQLNLTGGQGGALATGSVLSVNVKPAARIALRDGMTMFMQDAVSGREEASWLEAVAAGRVRSQGPYKYDEGRDLRGWRLYCPSLRLEEQAEVPA